MRLLHLALIALAVISLPLIALEPIEVARVGAEQLLTKTQSCNPVSTGGYKTYDGTTVGVPICKSGSVFFWKAGMAIDCDGPATANCNARTDPAYQNQTLYLTPDGRSLAAEETNYLVIPLPSWRFDYRSAGIRPGNVGAVIYDNKVVYAVFADSGPAGIIGEASYATAKALGIDPDPAHGGVSSGVTYLVFTGQPPDIVGDNAAIHQVGAVAAGTFLRS